MVDVLDLPALDGAEEVFAGDAANDTAETDAQIAGELTAMGLDQVMGADLDDALTEVIMRAAGAELYPEHCGAIVTYLNTR